MTFEQWHKEQKKGWNPVKSDGSTDYGELEFRKRICLEAWEAGLQEGEEADYRESMPSVGEHMKKLTKMIAESKEVACGAFPCICGICNEDVYPTRGA